MKGKLLVLVILSLLCCHSATSQSFDYPCKPNEIIKNHTKETERIISNKQDSLSVTPLASVSYKGLIDSLVQYNKELKAYSIALYQLKKEAIIKCDSLSGKKDLCLDKSKKLNEQYKNASNELFEKFLTDTLSLRNYYERFLTKPRLLHGLTSDSKRRERRINYLKRKHIDNADKVYIGYECLRNSYLFNCELSTNCNSDTCPSSIYDSAKQNCLCIPLCLPDRSCKKYRYDSSKCSCICLNHICPQEKDGNEYYWDSTEQICKKRVSAIVAMQGTDAHMTEAREALTKGLDSTKCLLSFATDGINAILTVGINLESKVPCSTYLKRLMYPDTRYELTPDFAKGIDTLLARIKRYIRSDDKISSIKIVGTADSATCHRIYEEEDMTIPTYYEIFNDSTCKEYNNTDFVRGKTTIQNPLLGLLRAYQFNYYIEKYFPGCNGIKFYSIPFKSKRGGYYRRVEMYILIRGFNQKYYDELQLEDQKEYEKAFKDCKICESYRLLKNCDK